jgi:hypothetical protein
MKNLTLRDAKKCNLILNCLVRSINKMPYHLKDLAVETKMSEELVKKRLVMMRQIQPAWFEWMYKESAVLLYRHYRDPVTLFMVRGGYVAMAAKMNLTR